jgi:hypothetical protein
MPRAPKQDDPAESKRFIEMARELGADESPKVFERTFKKIVPAKHPTPNRKTDNRK